jgi:hypothetical protein
MYAIDRTATGIGKRLLISAFCLNENPWNNYSYTEGLVYLKLDHAATFYIPSSSLFCNYPTIWEPWNLHCWQPH